MNITVKGIAISFGILAAIVPMIYAGTMFVSVSNQITNMAKQEAARQNAEQVRIEKMGYTTDSLGGQREDGARKTVGG